ncbi:MAG TPA: sugar transferase [Acidimicrobiia bacterium]|nr:sugar transferase [Acidimicrobiia bacterium]
MAFKRTIDIVLGAALAVLALPMIVLLAIGCAISLRAWPFYVSPRIGKRGRRFGLPKLRTLRPSVSGTATKYELDQSQIPRYCQILRRTHLDELPQLLLVPIGAMSLVGPRPEMPCLLSRYPDEVVAVRTSMRPGCTGLWQVSDASRMLIHESPEFDLAYIEHCNLGLDLWILYRTALIGLTGRADATLADVPAWAWRTAAAPSVGRGFDPATEPVLDLPFLERLETLERMPTLSVDVDA